MAPKPRIICPKCGQWGTANIAQYSKSHGALYLRVIHSENNVCFIGRVKTEQDVTQEIAKLESQIKAPHQDPFQWLLGFIEGEGYFYFGIRKNEGRRPLFRPAFGINLTRTDEGALKYIQEILIEKGIKSQMYYVDKHRNQELGINSKEQAQLRVTGVKNLLGLVRTLSSLRWHTKKEATFRAWAEALGILDENWEKPITEEVFQKIVSLRSRMNPDSQRGRVSY